MRFLPKITAVFLMGAALAGCASTTADITKVTGGDTAAGRAVKEAAAAKAQKTAPTDLDGGVRQAQLMRYAGQYDDAVRVLSQLMLVASDDPRVVSEYGKTLAQKGRAQDAVEFLNRAVELAPNDWSLYSALGVAYDQLGNQPSARLAYEHALTLHAEEPSVLNNYALSRMLAGDAAGAHALIARAQAAGGATDSKIAANIALLNKVAPQPNGEQSVAAAQKPDAAQPATPAAPVAPAAPAIAAPKPSVTPLPAPQSSAAMPHAMVQPPVAQAAPRALVPSPPPAPQSAAHPIVSSLPPGAQPVPLAPPQVAQQKPKPAAPGGVVMQAVPLDPLAGPVNHAPLAKTAANPADAKTAEAPKPGSPEQAAAIYLALGMTGTKDDAKMVKTADAKPTDAKNTKPVPVKTASKDDVPALRLTADARSP